MKVLHYIGTFSQLSETFVYELVQHLAQEGREDHHLLCHKRILEESRPFGPIQVCPVNSSIWGRALRWILKRSSWDPIEPDCTAQNIRKLNPDLIHAHFGSNGLRMSNLLRTQRIQIPLLIHCHGTDVLSLPYTDSAYRGSLSVAAEMPGVLFIANTEFLREAMIGLEIDQERIRIVRNATNTQFHQGKGSWKPGDKGQHIRLIAVGRLIRWKGHRYLLEALARVRAQHADGLSLTLIGEGEEREPLEKLAHELDIQHVVNFLGSIPHEEVTRLLDEHDALIQPSIVDPDTRQCESFGMTILEAVARGLPVIITRSGGMPELVGQETPWSRIVEPASASELAEGILQLVRDLPSLEPNAEYARSRLDFFCRERQLSTLRQVYQELTDGT